MGLILAGIFLFIVVMAAFASSSQESKSMKSVSRILPDGCALDFDQRVSGKSRKGVVTYYTHFVRATFTSPQGIKTINTFDFDHHNSDSKVRAYALAQGWVIREHQNFEKSIRSIETELPDTQAQPIAVNKGPEVAEKNIRKVDRYGRPIS